MSRWAAFIVFDKCLQLLVCILKTCTVHALTSVSFSSFKHCAPFNRSSASEEVEPLGDGPSDDDFIVNTLSSDEEDENDSSSISSKGDAEQSEESAVS